MANGGRTYVDIEGMSASLEGILKGINHIEAYVEAYNTDASTSLGRSSFKPSVEAKLEGIKAQYQALVPKLTEMKTKIEEIKNEYNIRASKAESLGSN